jgi:hypothetical protein
MRGLSRRWKALDPMREWKRADGETLYALHPLYIAMWEHYSQDSSLDPAAKLIGQRLGEIARGERRLPEGIAERIIEIDREQQASGCPDENIAGLVAALEGVNAR